MAKPYSFTNAAEVEEKIQAYFDWCEEKNKPLTMSGLAVWLDVDRTTLINYESNSREYDYSGIDPKELRQITNSIKYAKKRVQQYAEENLYREKGQVNGVIFALKNNHSWKDQSEVTTVNKDEGPDLSNLTIEQLQDLVEKISKKLDQE